MADTVDERSALSSLRQVPADLLVVGLAVALGIIATLPGVEGTPFGAVVRAAFVGFVPGYALVAVLFPARGPDHTSTDRTRSRRIGHITRFERAVLSVGVSCGLLAAVAGGLYVASVAGTAATAVRILAVVTAAFAAVAAVRRLALPPSKRFGRSTMAWVDALTPLQSVGRDLFSTVAVGFVVLFVLSSAVYAMVPVQNDGYTELYLLHEENGEAVSEDYPSELAVGQDQPLIVGIGNDEGSETTYTVVVQLQEVDSGEAGPTVQSATELDRFEVTLDDGETTERERVVTPDRSGENLRLTYLLYVGEPPESPDEENAYRSAYVWVDVTAPSE